MSMEQDYRKSKKSAMNPTNQEQKAKELEILSGNRLVAEFMGYRFNAYPDLTHHNITKPDESEWFYASRELEDFNSKISEYFKYHTSWDWLVPACHKWDNLDMGLMSEDQYPNYEGLCELLDLKIALYEIDRVWKQLVKNIEWYNSKNPLQSL